MPKTVPDTEFWTLRGQGDDSMKNECVTDEGIDKQVKDHEEIPST